MDGHKSGGSSQHHQAALAGSILNVMYYGIGDKKLGFDFDDIKRQVVKKAVTLLFMGVKAF